MRIGFHYACRLRFIFTEYKKKRTEISALFFRREGDQCSFRIGRYQAIALIAADRRLF